MWKPSSVVPHHRNRAIVVWAAMLIAALTYTVWQTAVVIRKRRNPSTKLLVSNRLYQFPVVTVCLQDTYGCGYTDGSIDACVASASVNSVAFYGDFDVISPSLVMDSCFEFDLTQFAVPEGERESSLGEKAIVWMDWISSDNSTAETEYSGGVHIFLGDSDSEIEEEESVMVPYSRNEASSNDLSYEETVVTIGKTSRKYLSGTSTTSYPVLTLSTTRYVTTKDVYQLFATSSSTTFSSSTSYNADTPRATKDSSFGSLFLEITQGSYSYTEVEDIEPLEIGALFGNIGGFWELLVLAWGVFFITKSRDAEPTLKGRNFAKKLHFGAPEKKRKRRKLDSAAAERAGHDGPRPPDWDPSSDDDVHASGASGSGVYEKGERSRRHRTHRRARPRRTVSHPLPRCVSCHSHSSSLGTSATTRNTMVLSRRSSASMADGNGPAMPSTSTTRRWSGSNSASAASMFNTFDPAMTQTRTAVFIANGSKSLSFSNKSHSGDTGMARTSFFQTPHGGASRIHYESEDESSQSATSPARGTNSFVENGEEAVENDLELGCGGCDSRGRLGEA